MYKNQLQELAQRSCFNLPSYACIREGPDHAPRFKATVNFNGETFESPAFWGTLRQAEHAAAEVALNVLSKKGPSKALATRVLHETGVYKNLLQETAHKTGLKLPVYSTIRSGPGHTPVFSCTVELAGMNFTGEAAKTKKQAQKNAAMAAWAALKQLSQFGSVSSSSASFPVAESANNDEQEQVTMVRYLSRLKPPWVSPSLQRNKSSIIQHNPSYRLIYPNMHWHNWGYSSHFLSSQHPLMYQNWPHHRSPPPLLMTPHIFPSAQSIFRPNHIPFLISNESIGSSGPPVAQPGHEPFLYLTNHVSLPGSSGISQVTIQELEEKPSYPNTLGVRISAKDEETNGSEPIKQFEWDSPRFKPRQQPKLSGVQAKYQTQPPLASDFTPQQPIRVSDSACSRSPWVVRMKNTSTSGVGSPNLMAPAVHVRSVVPVCSAPPSTSRKGSPSSSAEGKSVEETERSVVLGATISEFRKLQM